MHDRRTLSRPGGPPPGHDLPRLLGRLAAPRGTASAQDTPDHGEGALAALLDEIDQTVMARRLLLANAAGDELALEICNRRLLRAGPPEEGRAAARASGATLTYAGLEDLAALRAALDRFCGAGGVRVRERRPGGSASLEQTGVAVATLRQAWDLPLPVRDAAPEPPHGCVAGPAALRAALAARASAAAAMAADARDGRGPELWGEPAAAARLAACLGRAGALLEGEAASALILGGPAGAGDGEALAVLRDADGTAAFLVPGHVHAMVARLWEGVHG